MRDWLERLAWAQSAVLDCGRDADALERACVSTAFDHIKTLLGHPMREPFASWLADVADDDVIISAGDINAEARGNLWSFSLSADQAADVTAKDVEVFLQAIIGARRERLSVQGVNIGSIRFYCWNDEQAAQLRLSLVSASHGRLPFRCEVKAVGDLAEIVNSFLSSVYHDGILWKELKSFPCEGEIQGDRYVLPVWSLSLP